jgi:hypothetical protein
MGRFYFLVLLLVLTNQIQAQELEFDENCVLFQDTKTGTPVLILQDSILYKGNPLVKSEFKHTSYPDKLSQYVIYNLKEKTFLVQDGGGPVVEYRNDSIVACNKIPKFQNQISSAKFVYKNELYLFGGYGLFTFKNIVTKYDAKNKDWSLVQTFGDAVPSPRNSCYSYCVDENLYVFGGDEEDTANFPNFKKCNNTIWRLHLPTMHWFKIGKFDSHEFGQNSFLSFVAEGKLYLVLNSMIGTTYEIDIEKNTIKKFAEKPLIKPIKAYYDASKKELVCVTWISNGKYRFLQANLKTFLGKPISEKAFILPFYKEINTASIGFGIIILCIVFGITIYFKRNKKNSLLPFAGIIYKKETGTCYYKKKLIDNLEEPELRILHFLIENEMRFVSLNELNRLFENENNTESFQSIIKRRELTLASLLQKLGNLTNLPKKELLVNRKNPDDKRIKEIKIAPSFFRIK